MLKRPGGYKENSINLRLCLFVVKLEFCTYSDHLGRGKTAYLNSHLLIGQVYEAATGNADPDGESLLQTETLPWTT